MKRLFMAVLLLVISAPTLAHSIRYTVEGTYINHGLQENLLIPAEGKLTGWFEFDPGKSNYWDNPSGGISYYDSGFTFKFYIEGIRLFSKVSTYLYDPDEELKAGNLTDVMGHNVEFYPWSDNNHYRYSGPFHFDFNEAINSVSFSIISPCCEDPYYRLSAIGEVIYTEVIVPEPSSVFLLAFPLLLLFVYRRKITR